MITRLLILIALFGFVPVTAQNTEPTPPGVPPLTDDEIFADLNLDAPGLEKVKAAAAAHDMAAVKSAYLDYRRTACPARWRIMPSDRPAQPTATDDPKADDVVDHKIHNNYRMKPEVVDMGKDFNWYLNPLAKTDPFYSSEWTWCAVARTEFWTPLADAYWKTGNEKYAQAWVEQMLDFAAKNPAPADGQGCEQADPPSIWRGLENSIRAYNTLPYAYAHFLNSPSFTPEAQWTYLKLMQEHGRVLKGGLANQDRSGNHVTSEAEGLFTVGVLFPELKQAPDWRKYAIDRLSLELARIVPPDGMEAELTPGYHMAALNEFRGPLELAKLNNLTVPANFKDAIMSMYRAVVLDMDQSGHDVPTNDSWVFDVRKEAKYALKLADDPLLEWAASNGEKGTAPPDDTLLNYAGFYCMRSGWNPDDTFLFFRAGPVGIGHEHQDMLEIALNAWKTPLLIDEGRHPYDHSDWRRYCLGTPGHNTITVDDKWQHREMNKPPVEHPVDWPWAKTPLFDFVAATYDAGYQENDYNPKIEYQPMSWVGEIDHSVTHTRRLLFLKPGYVLVLDSLDGTGEHSFDAHFHMDAPAAHVDPKTNAVFTDRTDGVQLALYPLDKDNLTVLVVQGQNDPILGWIANEYEKRAIPTAVFHKKQAAPAIFATFLYPFQGTTPPAFSSAPLAGIDATEWGSSFTTAQEKIEVALARDSKPRKLAFTSALAPGVQVQAAGFVARRALDKGGLLLGSWSLTSYQTDKTSFTLAEPANLAFKLGAKPRFYNGGDKPVSLTMTRPIKVTTSLPPGTWSEITAAGSQPAAAP